MVKTLEYTGNSSFHDSGALTDHKLIKASNYDGNLMWGNEQINLQNINCVGKIKSSVIRTNEDCSGGQFLDVGFEVPHYGMVNSMKSCYDEKTETLRYTQFQLNPTKRVDHSRPNKFFKADEFHEGVFTNQSIIFEIII